MARTRFGRWIRDRFRRALGIADVSERTAAVQASFDTLAQEIERLGAKIAAIHTNTEAQHRSIQDLIGRPATPEFLGEAEQVRQLVSAEAAQVRLRVNESADQTRGAISNEAEQIRLRVREETDRGLGNAHEQAEQTRLRISEESEKTRAVFAGEVESVKLRTTEETNRLGGTLFAEFERAKTELERAKTRLNEEANRLRNDVVIEANQIRLRVSEESDQTRGAVATESVAIRQEVIVQSVAIQRDLAALIENVRGLNGPRSPEVLRLEAELREWKAKTDPRTAGFIKAADESRLIVMEYPPSYDFRARWGYTRPSHAGLIELFAKEHPRYVESLRAMVERLPNFERINREFSHDLKGVAGWLGGPQNTIDSAMLYHYVAHYKPKTYLEIGSGLSTLFAYRAVKDYGLDTRIVSIDPNPRALVDGVCDEVIREAFEMSDLKAFESLEPGDIVYMDGSHRTFPNSDVTVFMLDVLPKLKPGIIVHVHDILLPDDYPQEFVEWYWSEQYILAAYFLGMGDKIEYLMPVYYATQRLPEYREILQPVLDWWGKDKEDSWLAGGSIWFTHRGPEVPGEFY